MDLRHCDKGYAWVILAAAFVVLLITDGLHYTFGLLYVELLNDFSEGKAATVLPLSIRMGTTLFAGPFASGLLNRFGCRAVSVGGAVISAVGYGVAIFAVKLSDLYFTYGVIGGFGFGLLNVSANVIVVQYFEKRRALALGIMASGSGVGSFILNPLTRWLIDFYGWRGNLLIQSALILNCAVCGFLFTPVQRLKYRGADQRFQKVVDPLIEDLHTKTDEIYSIESKEGDINPRATIHQDRKRTNRYKKNILIDHAYSRNEITESDARIRYDNTCLAELAGIKSYLTECQSSFVNCFNFKVLKNPKCLLFLLARFWQSLGYEVPFTYIPDLALNLGFSKFKGLWIITVTAIGSTIGRIFLGWISDRSCVRVMVLYICCLVICGFSSGFLPLMFVFEILISSSFVFGFFAGGCVSLSPVLMTSLFGVEFVSEMYGMSLFAALFTMFISPPLTGWLYDATGSYTFAFILSGAEFWIGAITLLLIPATNKSRRPEQTTIKPATKQEIS